MNLRGDGLDDISKTLAKAVIIWQNAFPYIGKLIEYNMA